jgi:hypothetical protein
MVQNSGKRREAQRVSSKNNALPEERETSPSDRHSGRPGPRVPATKGPFALFARTCSRRNGTTCGTVPCVGKVRDS